MRTSVRIADASLPVIAGAIVAVSVLVRGEPSTRWLALGLALPAAATLRWRHRRPHATFFASAALVLALFAVDRKAATFTVVVPAIALYSLALTRSRRHLALAAVAAAAAVIATDAFVSRAVTIATGLHLVLLSVPLLAAEALRNRRSYVEEETQRRVEQERLRIARDVHDVVAHTLTSINVEASVAAHLGERQEGDAQAALRRIETASHEALDELRGVLGLLRTGDGGVPTEPAPTLDSISDLASVVEEGTRPDSISDAVQVAAYRIVQESVTNARRHSPGSPVSVRLAFRPKHLSVVVENPLTTTTAAGPAGVGLLGMRERAVALDGSVRAGADAGVFRVEADLPYRRG